MEREEERERPKFLKIIAATVLVIVAVLSLFLATAFVNVPVGYALLISDPITRTVSDVVAIGPSWYLRMPWQQAILVFYATDTFEDVVPCFSADQLEMGIEVLIRWSLDETKIKSLYQSYPLLNYKVKAIESIMEETIRLVTKNYTVIETIMYRDVVVHEIEQAVFKEIKEEPSLAGAMTHLEMDIKDITYPLKYTQAIEDKLVAEQQKIQAEFERERIIVLANATAQRLILEAQGQAQAKVIVANSIKEAIAMISQSIGTTNSTKIAELYMYLEALKQIAPDINVLIISTGEQGVPIIYQIPGNSTAP